jgi:acetylornithine deacetylase
MRFRTIPGIPTMTAAFTTDIPSLSNWGEAVLLGPGDILVAHTEREYLEKRELIEAIDRYLLIVHALLR